MAKADRAPEDQDRPLVLSSFVECPACESLCDAIFMAPEGVTERQDLVEAPTSSVYCTSCQETFVATYEGWTSYEDAG